MDKLTDNLAAATSTKEASLASLGGSLSVSRSFHWCSSLSSVGSSPNHPVGSSRLVVKKKLVTFSVVFVARLVQTPAKPRPNSRTFATSLSSNARLLPDNRTSPCSSASARVSSIPVVVYNLSFGSKSCKNGSVLLVSLSLHQPFSVLLVSPTLMFSGYLDSILSRTW